MGSPQRPWLYGAVAALLFSLAPGLRADDLPPATLRDFSKGLETTLDSTSIDDGASPSLVNVDVETGNIEKRGGSIAISSSSLGGFGAPVRFIYEYITPAGARWIISASSTTIFKSSNGGQNNSVLTSTLGFTTASQYCAVTAFGTMRLTDGTTSWITFDGTNLAVDTVAPHGLTCAFLGDRVWTSTGSILRATNINDVSDWTVTASSGDSDSIEQPIRTNDGQGITCLKPFKDRLLIFKAQSLDAYVLQEDGISYSLSPVSNNIGTSYCNSVVEREGDVVFLGPDAFYSYSPGTVTGQQLYKGYSGSVQRLSDAIKPTVKTIQQLDSNSSVHTETTQADFSAGTLSFMSASISPDNLVLSTWTQTDDSTADFQAFTSSSNVNITNGRVYLSTNDTNIVNNSFETGTSTTATNFVQSSMFRQGAYTAECGVINPDDGSWMMASSANTTTSNRNILTKIQDPSGSTLQTINNGIVDTYSGATGGCSWGTVTNNLSAYVGRWIQLRIELLTGGQYFTSDPFLCSGSTLTFRVNYGYKLPSTSLYIFFDNFQGGRSTTYSGSFTSQAMNSSFPSPLWSATTPTYTTNSHSITFQTASSADGVTWDAPVSWTPGSAPASAAKPRIRYTVTLSTGGTTNGVALPFVDIVPLAAVASTGSYQGAAFSTPVTSFGAFTAIEDLQGGHSAYAIYTDTNTTATFSNPATWISSQTLTSGVAPTLTPNTFAFLVSSVTLTASTQALTISELSLVLSGGSHSPVWSEYHLGSYLTAISTTSASTENNSVLIFDRNSSWTFYDHHWYCMKKLISGSILAGSNSDGKIYRFQDKTLNNDNGASIAWSWRSKDFDFGLPLTDKTMLKYYITADYAAGSTASFSYGVNRGATVTRTMTLDLYPGFFHGVETPSSTTYSRGIQHYFLLSGSGVDQSCVINSVTMKPRSETSP